MSFFLKHQSVLETNYPGITERILNEKLKGEDLKKIEPDLLQGKPLEYITKNKYFYNREFYIDDRVLIPRNETEVLVEIALKLLKNDEHVLDLCCGSGNIGLALLEEKKINLTLSDIDQGAIEVATKNAENKNVSIIQSNIYEKINTSFDLIVSNPPYISSDAKGVHSKVNEFEPHLALYVESSEYQDWFEHLFAETYNHLNNGGTFLMEGHEDKLEIQAKQMQKIGFYEIEILKDLTNRNRFLKGRK